MKKIWPVKMTLVGSEFSESDFEIFDSAGAVSLTMEDRNQLRFAYLSFQGMRALELALVAVKPLRRIQKGLAGAQEALDLLLDDSPDGRAALTVLLATLRGGENDGLDLSTLREGLGVIDRAVAKLLSTAPKGEKGRRSQDSATLFVVSVEAIYARAGGGGKRKFRFLKAVCDAAGCSIAGTDETLKRIGDKARRAASGAGTLRRKSARKGKSNNKTR